MDVYEYLVALPIYLGIIYFLANVIRSRNSNNPLYRKYFIKGLNYKIAGMAGFVCIYLFYYGGGDNTAFYHAISPIYKLFFSNPSHFFSFVFNPKSAYPDECLYECYANNIVYMTRGNAVLATIRVDALFDLFAFNSFIALTLIVTFVSYLFTWRTFRLFASLYPALEREFAIGFLMIPSVLFWGAGIGKDSIALSCIMNMTYCFYEMAIQKKNILINILLIALTAYIISFIRSYVLFTLGAGLILMTGIYYRNLFQNPVIRFVALPFFLAAGVGGAYMFIKSIGSATASYSLESLQTTAEGFHRWHTYLGETHGGSFYSLGNDVDYSAGGIAKKAPLALVITLFGPFLWQIRSPVMLMSGIEGAIFLYYTIKVFLSPRIYKAYNIIFTEHIIMFCVLFIITLGVAIGMTSFNYGSLVRYKIPILPFFVVLLAVTNYKITGRGLFKK